MSLMPSVPIDYILLLIKNFKFFNCNKKRKDYLKLNGNKQKNSRFQYNKKIQENLETKI